jgi:hypothetical protein
VQTRHTGAIRATVARVAVDRLQLGNPSTRNGAQPGNPSRGNFKMKTSNQTFTALAVFELYNEYGHQPETMPDGPNESEREKWDEYRASLVDEWRRPPSYITSDGDTTRFDVCHITGLRGDCVTFTAVWL